MKFGQTWLAEPPNVNLFLMLLMLVVSVEVFSEREIMAGRNDDS